MPPATVEKEITNPSDVNQKIGRLRKCVEENLEAKSDYFSATAGFKTTRHPEKEKHFAATTAEARDLQAGKNNKAGEKPKSDREKLRFAICNGGRRSDIIFDAKTQKQPM